VSVFGTTSDLPSADCHTFIESDTCAAAGSS